MMTERSPIPGPKIILLGDSGTGKTHSIRTLLEAGITPFIIFTEPGMEVLEKKILDQCHWRYIPPQQVGWGGLLDIAKKVNILDYEGVSKLQDANKTKYTEFLDIINQCNDFVDQHGKHWGDVMEFGTDKALILDSLSGLNDAASNLVVGGKPVKGQQDWQVAQNMLKKLSDKLCTGCHCTFVMMAHIAREKDEITGGTRLFVNTLGKALAPDLPAYYSDVIQTIRVGNTWTWDVSGSNIAVKGRNIPFASKQPPSFKPLIETWKKRGGVIEKAEETTVKDANPLPA